MCLWLTRIVTLWLATVICTLWTVISDLEAGDLLFVDVNLPFADSYLSYKGW